MRSWASERGEPGFVTLQYLAAIGLSLVFLAALSNLLVFAYGRGVVRAAVDEGVRAGSRADASAVECQQRAASVLRDLLGGALGDGVRVTCGQGGDRVTAHATVTFRSWAPMVPDWTFSAVATAVAERGPRSAP